MKKLLIALALCLSPLTAWAGILPYVGDEQTITLHEDDTMPYIARDYDLGYVELMAANPGLDAWLPGEGKQIIIPARHILPDAEREASSLIYQKCASIFSLTLTRRRAHFPSASAAKDLKHHKAKPKSFGKPTYQHGDPPPACAKTIHPSPQRLAPAYKTHWVRMPFI